MSIYVDTAMWHWRNQRWCHMMTDGDLKELHEFAKKLGLKRSWFQHKNVTMPHYDLSMLKRQEAIRLGAIVLQHGETNQLIQLWRKRKQEEQKK